MAITYLRHNQINKEKWDATISNAENGLVYALSWYLDIVSLDWEALIFGDYDAVMPLPVKKKYGVRYLIQPPFCQQLGLFKANEEKNVSGSNFLNQIPSEYGFQALNLNFNPVQNSSERINYELDLNRSYDDIKSSYSTNTKRNLSKAENYKLAVVEDLSPSEIIQFKKQNPVNSLQQYHYKKMQALIEAAITHNLGESYGITDENNNLVSVVFLINYKKRLTFLVSSSNESGKEKRAMFLLVDRIINKYAGSSKVFDFEGGSIQNLARFFGSFGAVPVKYYHYRRNDLIWPFNKLV